MRQNNKNNSYHLRQQSSSTINGNGMIFHPLETLIKSPSRSKPHDSTSPTQRLSREDDGRVERRKLLTSFHPTSPEVKMWTKRTWLNHQEKGRSKKRLQYCLDSNGNILNVRAIPCHTGEAKLIYLCETVENPEQQAWAMDLS